MTGPAKGLPEDVQKHILSVCKRTYRHLELSGYARIDLRLREDGRVFVMEANPNPQLAYGEDFAESAESAGLDYGPLLDRIMALGLRWETRRLG
jgi:D-alanine-D-alanine ligase